MQLETFIELAHPYDLFGLVVAGGDPQVRSEPRVVISAADHPGGQRVTFVSQQAAAGETTPQNLRRTQKKSSGDLTMLVVLTAALAAIGRTGRRQRPGPGHTAAAGRASGDTSPADAGR